jgi:hypothetical protein
MESKIIALIALVSMSIGFGSYLIAMGIQGLDPFIPAYVTGLAQGGVILYGVLVIALPVSAIFLARD